MNDLDWRWLRSFLAVAHAGGMMGASKASGISQPTLSRHVSALEEALGVALFDRSGRGVRLTPQGGALFERAQEIEASVAAFERQALGLNTELSGSVRVSMSRMFGMYFGPGWLASLQETHPHITVDLVLEDTAANLLLREAELALRMFRPTQLDLRVRSLGHLTRGFFASRDYIATAPPCLKIEDLFHHKLIGFDRVTVWLENAARMGYTFTREDFVCRTDDEAVHPRLAAQGLGVVVLPVWLGEQEGLSRLLPQVEMQGQPMFLTAPGDVHQNRRVSQVWEHLAASIEAAFG